MNQPLLEGETPKQLDRPMTPMELLQTVIQTQNPKDAVEVVKELVKLQNEMRLQDATIRFNNLLAECQAEIKLVVNDSDKTGPGGKRWASYRALDKATRPIWAGKGFSLSFGSQPSSVPNQMLSEAYLSLGMYSRTYAVPMDISGKGAQGGGALSPPHAILGGVEYSRRILLKMIFNIITGEEEAVMMPEKSMPEEVVVQRLDSIRAARHGAELKQFYDAAVKEATEAEDQSAPDAYWKAAVDMHCKFIMAATTEKEVGVEYADAANAGLDAADKAAINKFKGARNKRREELKRA